MKAWKIDLTPYDTPAEMQAEGGPPLYDVKNSLRGMLMSPLLKLNGIRLLENTELAMQIGQADGSILLEEKQYRWLKEPFETLTGFSGAEVELVRRVLKAEQVEVAESDDKEAAPPKAGEPECIGAASEDALKDAITKGTPLEVKPCG